jgi:transcriptional regulator with XRE-family HTH domain
MPACTRSTAGAHDPTWDIDRHVGARLRARRLALGLTQQQLAELIGVTYQQAQKYETGANRMTAQRLLTAAAALGVAVDHFFELLGAEQPSSVLAEQASGELSRILRDHPAIVETVLRAIGGQETIAVPFAAEGCASPSWLMAPQTQTAAPSRQAARPPRRGRRGSPD